MTVYLKAVNMDGFKIKLHYINLSINRAIMNIWRDILITILPGVKQAYSIILTPSFPILHFHISKNLKKPYTQFLMFWGGIEI